MEKRENKLIVAVVSLLLEEQLLQLSQCQYKTCSGKKGEKESQNQESISKAINRGKGRKVEHRC